MATTPFDAQDMADFLATWHSRSDDMDFSELHLASGRAVQAAAEAEEAQRNADAAAAWLETVRSARLRERADGAAIRPLPDDRQLQRTIRPTVLGHEPTAHNAGLHVHATARRQMISARSMLMLMLLLVLSLYGAYRLQQFEAGTGAGAASAVALPGR